MQFSINTNGTRTLAQQLSALRFQARELRQISRVGAEVSLATIRRLAPNRTGALRNAIAPHVERYRRGSDKHYTSVTVDRSGRQNATFQRRDRNGRINAYYPASQEYGWRRRRGSGAKIRAGRYYMQGGNFQASSAANAAMEARIRAILLRKGVL